MDGKGNLFHVVGDKQFADNVVNSPDAVIVDFYADWCGPCKKLGQILEQKATTSNGWKIAKISVDEEENREIATKHGVKAIPHVVLYHKGKIVDQFKGLDVGKLEAFIQKCQEFGTFQGQGIALGGSVSEPTEPISLEASQVLFDTQKPTTNISIRLYNGQSQTVQINTDDTVQVLYDHVAAIAPLQKFQLVAGFPPKPLTDMTQTIKDADLLDSKVIQKAL